MLSPSTYVTASNLASIETAGYGDAVDTLELFPLTLGQAGDRLGLGPEAVAELVRIGELGAYLAAGRPGGPPPTLRFTQGDLTAFTANGDTGTARLVAQTSALLRRYLKGCAPVPADDDAPMLARDRGREVYAHIQLEAFLGWIRTAAPNGSVDARVYFSEPLRTALRRLGCRPLRGIRPLHLDTMVWGGWWRVPQSLWSLSLEELDREMAR